MVTRRGFLLSAAAAAVSRAWASPAYLDFIHLTDTHTLKLAGVDERWVQKRRHYEHTLAALPSLFRRLKKDYNPAFIVHTGDAIDAFTFLGANGQPVYGQVEAFASAARKSPVPVYLCLGNHDIVDYGASLAADQSLAEQARAAWMRELPCFRDGAYYAFSRRVGAVQWRFVMLNNSYSGQAPGRKAPANNGCPDRAQLDWLEREISRYPADPLVIGMHHPARREGLEPFLETLAARRALTAVLSGHTHSDDWARDWPARGAPVLHVSSLAYAQGANHWRRIRLYEDRLVVFKTGPVEEVLRTEPVAPAKAAAA
jgi:3',5'-cyclic AMP phosphodiesterase CpdA